MSDERKDNPGSSGEGGGEVTQPVGTAVGALPSDDGVPREKSKVKVTMQLNAPLVVKDATPLPGRGSSPGSVEGASVSGAQKPTPVPRVSDAPITTETTTGEVTVRYYGMTDVGLVREHNEDNFIVADLAAGVRGLDNEKPRETSTKGQGVLLAVCDGMGGAAAGEVASQMAVDTIYDVLSAQDATTDRDVFARRLVHAVEAAGGRIFASAKADRTRRGMGTTSTVAGLMDKVLFIGQVGDSRAYLRRGNKVTLITKDQSLVNQLIEAGQLTEEEAEAFEHSNIILQALGTTEEVQVDLTFLELRQGDRLMLCSDGLSGLVHPELIADVLKDTEDLVACCKKLIEMANAGGGHDNITVICADFNGDGLAPPDVETPALYQQYPLPPDATGPHGAVSAGAATSAVVGHDDDPPVLPTAPASGAAALPPSKPRRLVAVALITLGIGIGIGLGLFLAFAGDLYDVARASTRKILHPRATQVEVTVITDAEGELFIDGDRYGSLHDGKAVTVKLMTGGHRFEARSGGSSVASADVSVEKGHPTTIQLRLPLITRVSDDGGVVVEDPDAPSPGPAAAPPKPANPAPPAPAPAPAPRTAPSPAPSADPAKKAAAGASDPAQPAPAVATPAPKAPAPGGPAAP